MHPGKLALLIPALLLALPAGTAETAYKPAITRSALARQSAPQAPTLKVYSREKIVDVTVTDAHGNPVHGLTQADFLLKEDGKPQSLRSFHEFGEAVPTAAPTTPPKLPPNVYTNLQPAPPSPAVNILLLDFVNTAPDADIEPITPDQLTIGTSFEMQRLMKNEAIKYIQSMPSGTRVAILGMSWPGSLRVLQGVTSDPALLTAAVNTMEPVIQHPIPKIPMTIEALNQLAAVAMTIKGRKNLVWFTYGVPPSGGILRAIKMLAEAQVTTYSVGARGGYYVFSKGHNQIPVMYAKGSELLNLEGIAEAGGGISSTTATTSPPASPAPSTTARTTTPSPMPRPTRSTTAAATPSPSSSPLPTPASNSRISTSTPPKIPPKSSPRPSSPSTPRRLPQT
jgi:VWFA-related protein